MDASLILKLVLVIEVAILFGNAVAISRDYQDSWVLEGLEVPFTVLLITYLIYFSVEKNPIWLLAFALIFGFTFLALPNLKYQWFLGYAVDQHHHSKLAQDIFDDGYIRTGDLYSGTPSMHLSFAMHSIITGLPIIYSLKYFPTFAWLIFPIVTYVVTKDIFAENLSIQKFALFLSSFPVKPSTSYLLIGTLFGPLLTFLVLSQFITIAKKSDRRYLIIMTIYTLALAATHSFSSIAMAVLLSTMFILSQSLRRIKHISTSEYATLSFSTLLPVIIISIAWFSQVATTFMGSLKSLAYYMTLVETHNVDVPGFFTRRFFDLGLLEALRVILVFHGADVALILLTLIGWVIMYKKLRKESAPSLLLMYTASFIPFLFFGYVFDIGLQWYDRAIRLFLVVTPIFSGLSLHYLKTKMRNIIVPMLIIGLLLILSTVELYRCEPLVPAASSLSKDLPDDEPIVYVNLVNSIYQRRMIAHAERFLPQGSRIASDEATQNQLLGFTNLNFYRAHTRYYPLSEEEPKSFDYFLLHLPGKSGGFVEQAEIRTKSLVLSAIFDSSFNVIYTNGESYILGNKTSGS